MGKISTDEQAKRVGPGIHKIAGMPGLYLKVGEAGRGSYFWRFRLADRRREIGLGPRDRVSLAEAIDAAKDADTLRRKGADPIDQRRGERAENIAKAVEARAKVQGAVPFEKMVEAYLATHAPGWKHRYARSVWVGPLRNYAYPVIGSFTLDQITIGHVIEIIDRAERAGAPVLARRVQARIEQVLNAQIALSGVAVRNPADLKLISAIRPMKRKGPRPHFRAVKLADAPEVFRQLRAHAVNATVIAAWVFMIACASRPSEALGARWDEIDWDEQLWRLPPERMKGGIQHVVPLSQVAFEVLALQWDRAPGDAIFPGRSGSPVSYSVFAEAPRRLGVDAATAHGWRSVFRDWAGETNVLDKHAEFALAHGLPAVVGSYHRLTAVEQRRAIMADYAVWLSTDTGARVVAFERAAS